MLSSSPTLPSTTVRPFASGAPSVELPKLRIPIEAVRQETGRGRDDTRAPVGGYHAAPPVPVKTEAPTSATMQHGPSTRSPSSPSSFFTQPEIAKVGLAYHCFKCMHLDQRATCPCATSQKMVEV